MGEVNVAQENLNSFLAVAEDLKVKGLTQTEQNQQERKILPDQSHHTSNPPPQARQATNKQPKVRTSYEHAMASASALYEKEMEDITPLIKTEAPMVEVDCEPQI